MSILFRALSQGKKSKTIESRSHKRNYDEIKEEKEISKEKKE